MTLIELKYIVAVAREKNFGRGAAVDNGNPVRCGGQAGAALA
jgi:hypothetical protein